MLKTFVFIYLFSYTILYAYDSCQTNQLPSCDKKVITSIEENLSINFDENNEIFLFEIIRNQALEENSTQILRVNEILNCLKEKPTSKPCQLLLENKIQQLLNHNLEMRLSLALWDSEKPDDYNFDNSDEVKIRKKPKHLSFVTKTKIAPLTPEEKEMALSTFEEELASELEKDNLSAVTEKPKDFVDILAKEKAIRRNRLRMADKYKSFYLNHILTSPVLKYIKEAKPTQSTLINSYEAYLKDLISAKNSIQKMPHKKLKRFLNLGPFMSKALAKNTYFCKPALEIKKDMKESQSLKELVLSFGGLALCPFSGITCAGAVFGGNAVNAYESHKNTQLLIDLGSNPNIVNQEDLSIQLNHTGQKYLGVILATPVGLSGRLLSTLAFTKTGLKKGAHQYLKEIQEEGFKRIYKPGTIPRKTGNLVAKGGRFLWDGSKNYVKEVKETKGLRLLIAKRDPNANKQILDYINNPIATTFNLSNKVTLPVSTAGYLTFLMGTTSVSNNFANDNLEEIYTPLIPYTPGSNYITNLIQEGVFDPFEGKQKIIDHYNFLKDWYLDKKKSNPRIKALVEEGIIPPENEKVLEELARDAHRKTIEAYENLKLEFKDLNQIKTEICKDKEKLQQCEYLTQALPDMSKRIESYDITTRSREILREMLEESNNFSKISPSAISLASTSLWPLVNINGENDIKLNKMLMFDTEKPNQYLQTKVTFQVSQFRSEIQSGKFKTTEEAQAKLDELKSIIERTGKERDEELLHLIAKGPRDDLYKNRQYKLYDSFDQRDIGFNQALSLTSKLKDQMDEIDKKVLDGKEFFPQGRLNSLNTPDILNHKEEVYFRSGPSKKIKIDSDLTLWRLAIIDPRFHDLKELWLNYTINDGSLLQRVKGRILGYNDLTKLTNDSHPITFDKVKDQYNFQNPEATNPFLKIAQAEITKYAEQFNPTKENLYKCITEVTIFWANKISKEVNSDTDITKLTPDKFLEFRKFSKAEITKHDESYNKCKIKRE